MWKVFGVLVIVVATAQGAGLFEKNVDRKLTTGHTIESLNLLIMAFLLILTVLTRWITMKRRFWYIHYTGLALIYGKYPGGMDGTMGQEV